MSSAVDPIIKESFSRASSQYDVLASLHREIGRELTRKIVHLTDDPKKVLDVGMGTGWLSNRLQNVFDDCNVIGVDVSDGMVEKARAREGEFKIIQADAYQLPFQNQSFDLVTSNLAFQWVTPLEKPFLNVYDVLKNDGVFCGTLFGFQTFQELFETIEKNVLDDSMSWKRLPSFDEVEKVLDKTGFRDVKISNEIIKVKFKDMIALLKWIKGIGANRLNQMSYLRRDWLSKANQYYSDHFNDRYGVYTTFEVIWFEGKK